MGYSTKATKNEKGEKDTKNTIDHQIWHNEPQNIIQCQKNITQCWIKKTQWIEKMTQRWK